MKRWQSAGVAVWLGACGGSQSGTATTNHNQPTTHRIASTPPASPASPATRIHAINFGGLVRGIQGLIDGTPHADLGCLLGVDATDGGAQVALGVTPAPALGTVPEAPMHLAEGLAQPATHARVLTRWGQRGEAPFDLVVATLTPLPPQALADPMVVLVITRVGVVVRETDGTPTAPAALTHDDAAVWLLERTARGPVTVIVTAEAEAAATDVHALLKALPSSVKHSALAVALAPDTRLPDNAPQAPDARTHCPNGLPEPDANAPEGELPSASIVRSLSFIHEPLQRCLANTTGPGAIGGKVVLALRIVDTGNVSDTCLVEDAIGDNVLAACLTETARTATFSRPHPIGFVDVHIPLSLSPVSDPPARPVCE